MKIAIDGRPLQGKPAGVANVLINGLSAMSRLRPEWKFYLLLNRELSSDFISIINKLHNVTIHRSPLPVFSKIGFIWYLLKARFVVDELKPDFYWASAAVLPPFFPQKIKTVCTTYDVVFSQFKKTMSLVERIIFNLLFSYSIKRADIIWVISNYTKNEIINFVDLRQHSEFIVGIDIDKSIFKKLDISAAREQELLSKYSIHKKFILFVGTLEPRKNLTYLLSLMPDLSREGYSLLIVGGKGWGKTNIAKVLVQESFPRENVCFAGFIATDELAELYNIASVYVSTSLNEGFGLPQLEAMSCGCPVVSPHNSAMIEVVEGAGITVKSWDRNDWIDAIVEASEKREYYQKLGFARTALYSWDDIATKLIDLM